MSTQRNPGRDGVIRAAVDDVVRDALADDAYQIYSVDEKPPIDTVFTDDDSRITRGLSRPAGSGQPGTFYMAGRAAADDDSGISLTLEEDRIESAGIPVGVDELDELAAEIERAAGVPGRAAGIAGPFRAFRLSGPEAVSAWRRAEWVCVCGANVVEAHAKRAAGGAVLVLQVADVVGLQPDLRGGLVVDDLPGPAYVVHACPLAEVVNAGGAGDGTGERS